MISYTIHIVDDEPSIREGMALVLEADYTVDTFDTAESAIEAVKKNPPDLILLDIGLPGMDGIEALEKIKDMASEVVVIMITAYEDIQSVISAMKLGAYDYVVKPIHMDGLQVTIKNALQSVTLKKEVQILQEKYLEENTAFFIGESNAIQTTMEFIGVVAQSPDTPILIIGDTGTGKELIASAIHYRSPNFKGSFVTLNCAAIPRDLIESELFGYEKGAFSGASVSGKKGVIEEAANGTLFLDEVGDLSLEAQAKLLRFIEEGEFYRVGGTKKIKIFTRIVSATNKNLALMMEKDLFRKDLYFRLGVIKVEVPSLNERREDIIPLSKHFLFVFSRKFNKPFSSLSSQAEEALMAHEWIGNVRELKNAIERGVLIGKGPELTVENLQLKDALGNDIHRAANLPFDFPPIPLRGIEFSSIQKSLEKYYFDEAFKLAGGNESKAASYLNMNHHTFRYRRKKLLAK
ncbi:MAG: sigma-54-dependent Fis family transcriptional regulator [Deltaproteobacteria bacterium]|nr:sigma-54-dependent Fis family transcriptional regulator [Deltaproteobacteria bacterium]